MIDGMYRPTFLDGVTAVVVVVLAVLGTTLVMPVILNVATAYSRACLALAGIG